MFFGPLLVPKLIGFYRRLRAAPRAAGLAVSPAPPSIYRCAQLLLGVGIFFLIASFSSLQPENMFYSTQSRLQIPTDTLFNRVATLRPEGKLTPTDESLRHKFVNMESRYLYAAYGPDAVANCLFCTSEDPKSFLLYNLPELLAPHLVNLVLIGITTSTLLGSTKEQTAPPKGPHDNFSTRAKKAAAQWRYTASVAAVVLMAFDTYMLHSVDPMRNKTAKKIDDVMWTFWIMRTTRFFALGILDFCLSALIFLSGTNRAFVVGGRSPAERVLDASRNLLAVRSKMSAAGIIKNTAARDADMRKRSEFYWAQEVAVMSEVMQEREVLDGINDAVGSRLNLDNIQRDAEAYADSVVRPLLVQQAMNRGQQGQIRPNMVASPAVVEQLEGDKKVN
ncbi:hypothetical protein MKZ38_005949 [Zalerion maritima]|uniref:Uncharacterized protein n=1 Tax=Zalerion maritima TaxID=339359 RepID=A0AAD5RXR3_9PEZI|nr:hypothetical protein MKZ38_005949 [Zalerion maritima]